MKSELKNILLGGLVFFTINYNFNKRCYGDGAHNENNSGEVREIIPESELEGKIDRLRESVAKRYVNSYLSEARERVGTIENLVDERGYDYVGEIFMDEQEVPFSVLRGEIEIDEAVSEMGRLYGKVDNRMNWNSPHIRSKIREDIEFKVSMYEEMISQERYNINEEEVRELIDLSEGLFDGIKDELKSNSQYVGLIPGGRFVMLLIADKMMNPSRKATRNAYESLLEEEGNENE